MTNHDLVTNHNLLTIRFCRAKVVNFTRLYSEGPSRFLGNLNRIPPKNTAWYTLALQLRACCFVRLYLRVLALNVLYVSVLQGDARALLLVQSGVLQILALKLEYSGLSYRGSAY